MAQDTLAKNIQITNEHMKMHSMFVITRELQINIKTIQGFGCGSEAGCLHPIPTTQTKTILFAISEREECWHKVAIAVLGRLREDGKLKGKMMETVKRSVVVEVEK